MNINNNIKTTAEKHPEHFWIYNNGLTAIVNDYSFVEEGEQHTLKISGISIVNGAQTTGAIGSLEKIPADRLIFLFGLLNPTIRMWFLA
jgi:hypothetical protein